mgnify:CR=1 FL=1
MAFVPAANVLQVELLQTLHGSKIENTLYFRTSTPPWDDGAVDILNTTLETWWNANIKPSLSSDLAVTGIYCTDLTTQTSPTYERVLTTAGALGSDALPANNALSVSFKTLGRGRSSRGRNYVAGISELNMTGNSVQSSVATAIRDGYGALIAAVAASGFEWVVVSRYFNKAPRASALVQPITTVTIANVQIDSQRRRVKQS